MNARQLGTFNTIAQNGVQIGGDFPVWSRVDKVYQGGGYLDLTKFKPGDVIHAGTMVKFNGAGKMVEVITAEGTPAVVTLTFTKSATAANAFTIVLGDLAVEVAPGNSDNAEALAGKVKAANASFTGWNVASSGATVTFTQKTAAKVSQIAFIPGTSGTTATIGQTTEGVAKTGTLTDVNGLVRNDVCIPDGCTLATCAVVYAGRIYADRVFNGGIPTSVEEQLPMIEFVREG